MLDQPALNTLSKNDKIDHFLVVRKIELRSTRAGKNYLATELGDKTTTLNVNIWEGFEEIEAEGKIGDVVKVAGMVEEYQGALQIKVVSIKLTTPSDSVSAIDFLPESNRDFDQMKKELKQIIKSVKDSSLNKLLQKIFSGKRLEQFCNAPAGKSWHHAYIHGLLEHTLEIIKICELMCEFHPELNRDLLISGALLHDIGKTEELSYDSAFEYTDKGKLVGHIVIAASLVQEEIKNISDFPLEMQNNLLHLILSHQGKLEHASPVVPKTVEAIVLYQADELSAKGNAYKNALLSEIRGNSSWTRYISLADTDLHKHNITNEQKESINKSLFE